MEPVLRGEEHVRVPDGRVAFSSLETSFGRGVMGFICGCTSHLSRGVHTAVPYVAVLFRIYVEGSAPTGCAFEVRRRYSSMSRSTTQFRENNEDEVGNEVGGCSCFISSGKAPDSSGDRRGAVHGSGFALDYQLLKQYTQV